ncbi:MAG: ribonuclease HIII [Kiritimatiellae bacterium]|nr:ribonuclease HIII [Kiritimatiellia bacterium]
MAKTSYTFRLSEEQQATLTRILREGNYVPTQTPHTLVSVNADTCRVALYASGKCLVQGKGAEEFVSFVLEPLVLREVVVGYEEVLDPQASAPHMGVDESGKGDFFGPLVVAGAYVDESLVPAMRELDVKDSKKITSDKKLMQMARDLRKLLGRRYTLVVIGPEAYNRLYDQMKNLNRMLAWGHARAIENLLQVVPSCPRAVSDQFGSKQQVKNALMRAGRRITLEQRHRAESDIAVAAASVLARASFLFALNRLEEQYKVPFPKGASTAVREAAAALVKREGATVLGRTAKCHFRTVDAVLTEQGLDRSALAAATAAVTDC